MTVYLMPARHRVAVSKGGSDFKPHTLRKQLQCSSPTLTTNTTMTFTAGRRQVLVDREYVVVSRFDGMGGTNQFGA